MVDWVGVLFTLWILGTAFVIDGGLLIITLWDRRKYQEPMICAFTIAHALVLIALGYLMVVAVVTNT
jgi:hypothetical protein